MITRLKLKPGQKGTKQLLEKYGDALICVRYRYDAASNTRIKTIELVVERKVLKQRQQKIADDVTVPVKIAYEELELVKMAKSARGRWDPDVKLWYVRYGRIKGTDLERRVVLDAGEKRGKA